jgi:hypothetical protein
MLIALLSVLHSGSGNLLSNGHANAAGAVSPINANLSASLLDQLKQADPNQNQSNKPKAYLNYVVLDNLFYIVSENSGVKQVQDAHQINCKPSQRVK